MRDIRCFECGGFVGYATGVQPLPHIVHGPCGERMRDRARLQQANPFSTPLDDPRVQKMIDEAATVLERQK